MTLHGRKAQALLVGDVGQVVIDSVGVIYCLGDHGPAYKNVWYNW